MDQIKAVSPLEKNLNVIVAFLWLVAGYAMIHRLLVPLVLKATALKGSAYAHVDLWFLHPLALSYWVGKNRKLDFLSCFLAGAGIVQGAWEIYEGYRGLLSGWLLISHLLSSVPFSLLCILLLSGSFEGLRSGAAWLGAISWVFLHVFLVFL